MSFAIKSDFVSIRLTEAGRAFAGPKGMVRIANAHMSYKFSADAPQRVLTSEWTRIFAAERCQGGKPMFELVEPSSASTAIVSQPIVTEE